MAPLLAHDGPHVTVHRGDTLSQIALSNGVDMTTLMKMNNLSNPNGIRIGQSLALPGVSSSGTQVSAASSSSNWTTYTVRSGDTLGSLAWQYQIGLAKLAEMNQISWNQRLYIGQQLRLPSTGAATPVSSRPSASIGVVSANQTHTVRQGEHLGTIAAKYGTTVSAISRANGLLNPSVIVPGQELAIPIARQQGSSSQASASQAAPQPSAPETDPSGFPTTTEKWIDVRLSTQTVTAYNGIVPVATFLVSTGLPWTPTVQGTFRIWSTTPIQDMSGGSLAAGDNYYIRDVEHVQYFHQGYAFHAAHWHNNFGQPMSRGCVNMRPGDAEWLFNWASPQVSQSGWTFLNDNTGTLVRVRW
ncbi:MAG: LysM peptidoglycan-binding domain-containing protein [Chloroflexota bacterium]